jgi:hydroxyacylglutathione hydrolase
MLAQGVRWFDDWFAIEEIAPGVTAIGEPRFHQNNWNYLIEGESRALLFDTGPGVRDISEVVKALTALPVTAMPSHLHFDHVGNLHRFPDLALADLPVLRACMRDGLLIDVDDHFRGYKEGMTWKPVAIARWLPMGKSLGLGGRPLELFHTPGHSPDSVSLLDAQANILFAADFVYRGDLYAQIPGADLAAYLDSAETLLPLLNDDTIILGAHGMADGNGKHRAPRLTRADIADLIALLKRLRVSGERPQSVPVNARMTLLTWEPAFATWQRP